MWGGLRRLLRPLWGYCVLALAVLTAVLSISPAFAQNYRNRWIPEKPGYGGLLERANSNNITIVSGGLDSTDLSIASDLAVVLDDGDDFRVIPVIGRGGGQSIRDVRFLKGVDLGITQTNILNAYRRANDFGALDGRIVYIAKLYNEEMHLLVRARSGVTSVDQLGGKKVSFGEINSGTQLTARDIFGRLGIKPDEVNLSQADALERLKSGEIAAAVLIGGKPSAAIAKLKGDDGLRLLPVPFAKQLHDDYLPAVLSEIDYPGMVQSGDGVSTIAVGAVLIAYNWPKGSEPYRRLESFVGRFFQNFSAFLEKPRHPKWREVNLAAVLPGWARFATAEEWVARNREMASSRTQFEQFLQSQPGQSAKMDSAEGRERLFSEFIKWSQARERR